MKCLILAAGYATRLYPLTEHFPKPLLEVQGKTILDWLLEDIDKSGVVDQYVVISNHKFARQFQVWADQHRLPITVLDDGTESNETRLGAVRDRILSMEEKPAEPKSHWCTPPFYIYKASDVGLVKVGIDSGCGVDAPGSFIAWLSSVTPVHAYEMPGKRYDIGNLQSYEEVKQNYHGIDK